jgi:hypothetical protein
LSRAPERDRHPPRADDTTDRPRGAVHAAARRAERARRVRSATWRS